MTGSKSAGSGMVPGLPARHGTQGARAAGRGVPAWAEPTLTALASAPGREGEDRQGWTGSSQGAFLWLSSSGCDVVANSLARTQVGHQGMAGATGATREGGAGGRGRTALQHRNKS